MSAIKKVGGIIFWAAVVWLVVAGGVALQFWPAVPNTAAGWVAFIAFDPHSTYSERQYPSGCGLPAQVAQCQNIRHLAFAYL